MIVNGYRIEPGEDLRNADLQRANLRGADLRGADLRDANLQNADLRLANVRNTDFRGADLQGASLWGANFRNADFQGANLRNTDFRGVDLWDTDFRGTDLQGADLWGAIGEPKGIAFFDMRDSQGCAGFAQATDSGVKYLMTPHCFETKAEAIAFWNSRSDEDSKLAASYVRAIEEIDEQELLDKQA